MKDKLLILLVLVSLGTVDLAASPPGDRWGVTCWASWRPDKVNRQTCPEVVGAPIILSWRNVEPADGDFRFAELLDDKLRLIEKNDYGTKAGSTVARTVQCHNSGHWKEEVVMLNEAVFNQSLEGKADLILQYANRDDTIFHMIEINR